MSVVFEDWLKIEPRIVAVRGDDPAVAFPGLVALNGPQPVDKGSLLTFDEVLRDGAGKLLLARASTVKNEAEKKPFLNAGWNLCQLSHYGTDPIVPWGTLQDWDPTNTRCVQNYASWTDEILKAVENNGDLSRLEGAAPFYKDGEIVWDFIRIVYVANALTNPGPNGSRDWVAFGTAFMSDRGRQEGGGHGPPH